MIITENLLYDLVGLVITIVVVAIAYMKWVYTYWDRRGVQTLSPQIVFGDIKGLMMAKLSFGEQLQEIYEKFKAKNVPHGGMYFGPKPFYMPIDPEIIKNIMQKDFGHFVNHGFFTDPGNDPLSAHLFNLEDAKWRNMRTKLSPTFTSGKMKMMFQTVVDCAAGLKEIMDETSLSREPVEIKEILARFTTDVIGSCAFGLECNSLKNPDAEFRKYGRKIFEIGVWDQIKTLLAMSLPHSFLKVLKLKLTKNDVEEFFMDVVKKTAAHREKNNVHRKDFFQLLLQLKNFGTIKDDGKVTDGEKTNETGLTMDELTAQAFVFFVAGFETSSTTMTWALYELTQNLEVQDKLRNEINEVLKKHDNKLTYDAIMEMTYLEKVIDETLRKHSPVPFIPRQCTKDYQVPGTGVTIEKGINVAIPAQALHMDPQYFPNPEKFDPERFSEENKSSRPAFTWIPFGEGPRICIGLRFGMLQSKIGLTTVLKNYRIKLNNRTNVPVNLDKRSFIKTPDEGIWIEIEKIE